MIGALSNHLWQSTCFVAGAAILAAALRQNGAHVRHLVWLSASMKFLVPFSPLVALGGEWAPARAALPSDGVSPIETASFVVDQISQPFTGVLPAASTHASASVDWVPLVIGSLWAVGFIAIVVMRLRGWARVRVAVRASVPFSMSGIESPSRVDVRTASGLLEPGIVGLWRPVLLLPAGIHNHLSPIQLEAVLTHELCHVRRRDNITAVMHMIVESVFWFHPLVWWIGARLVDERERACDEHVLSVLGAPEAYAESILKVCKLYVESPLICVSGVTGSNLKKRIEAIMVNRIGLRLNFARRLSITLAAVLALVAPVVVGIITAPIHARGQDVGGSQRFEVVSIKPCAAASQPVPGAPAIGGGRGGGGGAPWHAQTSPGRVFWDCVTLSTLVDQAYADIDHPLLNMIGDSRPTAPADRHSKRVRGGPFWAGTETFTLEVAGPPNLTAAALAGATRKNLATLPAGLSHALRAALEDRFQLKVHRAVEQQDMYALKVGVKGLSADRMKPTSTGECVSRAVWGATDPADRRHLKICGDRFITMISWEITGGTMHGLAEALSESMDRYVLDETNSAGMFNFVVQFRENMNDSGGEYELRVIRALDALGLRIQPTKGTAEYLVIDRAERPTPDSAFPAPAQASPQADQPNKFEVASVKPCETEEAPPGGRSGGGSGSFSPGRAYLSCFVVKNLIDAAYVGNRSTLKDPDDPMNNWPSQLVVDPSGPQRIRGGPDWVYKSKYSIEAKAPGTFATTSTVGSPERAAMMGPMLRSLLEDRFQLKVHREFEETPMWDMVIASGGLKIRPMPAGGCTADRSNGPVTLSMAKAQGALPTCGTVSGEPDGPNLRYEHGGQKLAIVATMLSEDLGIKVVDKTGIADVFNFSWTYGPDENTPGATRFLKAYQPDVTAAPTAASVFKAIEEQLGLKLVKTKGQRAFIVIDHIERPGPDLNLLSVRKWP
jgi:bla regulator protein BlaR1